MVNVNKATRQRIWFCRYITLAFMLSFSLGTNAQCSLACNGTTQVSLDSNCEAEITPDMILNDDATSCPNGDFSVVVMDHYNNPIATSPVVTGEYCDQTLIVKIIDLNSGNTCWSEILVEDKLPPTIDSCPAGPVDYSCSDFTVFDGPVYLDACSGYVEPVLISETVSPLNCDPLYIKQVVRTYTAYDQKGNRADDCTITYRLNRIDLSEVICPIEYTVANGNALNCDGSWDRDECHEEGFTGLIDPSVWSVEVNGSGGNEILDVSNAPNSISLTASDDGIAGATTNTDLCFDNSCAATFSFSYLAEVSGGGAQLTNDEPAYTINSLETILATGPASTASGMVSVSLNPGDEFCFRVKSNNQLGRTLVTFSTVSLWGLNGIVFDTDTNDDGINDTEINGLWDDNGNGYPDVEEFPAPSINGVSLYPTPDFYCNIGVFYNDIALPQIGCVRKIMRTWSVREWWCGTEVEKNCVQIFEIVDEVAPVIECSDSYTITTNITTNPHDTPSGQNACAAEFQLPIPVITDNCSEIIHIDLTFPEGHVTNYQAGDYITLPMGKNIVTLTAYDECYNTSTCEIAVNVEDNTPPVAICDEFTVVSLTTDGKAHVPAEVFDDGSYDDCQLKKMLVRRMDNNNCDCPLPTYEDMDYLGEYLDEDGNPHYYYLSQYSFLGPKAEKFSDAMGGYAAVINTAEENTWLTNTVNDKYGNIPYYIGLSDEKNEGNFLWSNGSFLTNTSFSQWAPGYPNNAILGDKLDNVLVNSSDYWTDVNGWIQKERFVMELENPCTFSSFAEFCCEDIGEDQMVVFRVVDVCGNYNDCMVTAEIQDKLAPYVTCPDHMIVECDTHYDLENLSVTFGEPTYYDNCEDPKLVETVINNLNQCNIGELKRIFTVTDAGGRSNSCEQVITFINTNPFTEEQITWPDNYEDNDGCFDTADYHPDEIGYPTFLDDQCDLVGANWEDQLFVFNDQPDLACFKILRYWSIIDWCQEDANGVNPQWHHTQVIKINNTVGPEVDCPDEISVCTYDADCATGEVQLTLSSTGDDCTEPDNLIWGFEIDLDCDGTIDSISTQNYGPVANASDNYPLGSHCITWWFSDQCGNRTSCLQYFHVLNCKAPTPYCINGLAVDLMPVDTDGDGQEDWGMVEMWASDFDAGSYHSCGYDVILSFEADTTVKNAMFDCTTLGEQDVEIWATVELPDGTLVQSYCETYVVVQDNNNVCPTGGLGGATGEEEEEETGGTGSETARAIIEGTISTELQAVLGGVSVAINGAEGMNPSMTNDQGEYAFPPMDLGGNYQIDPSKNDDALNGVTTLDLVRIRQHILDIDAFNSPYKYIAADVNSDKKITAIDLIELRKLILGVYNEFPNNDSWRFIDEQYQFLNSSNPLLDAFPERYNINGLGEDMNINFVAVKIGDVNGTIDENLTNNTSTRSDNRYELVLNQIVTEYTTELTLSASKNVTTYGFQFALETDNAIQIKDIKSNIIGLNNSNFGFNISKGIATISAHNENAISIKAGQPILTIEINNQSDQIRYTDVKINTNKLSAELYNADYSIDTPVIGFVESEGNTIAYEFELYQNTPNPFTGSTEIGFSLPKALSATLVITDINGKVLFRQDGDFAKGKNSITVSSEALNNVGVMYYTLESEMYSATKKMVVLR